MNPCTLHHIDGPALPGLPPGAVKLAVWEHAGKTPGARPVLYVHGATFPIELAFAFRFDGVSWADHLAANGFWPWGLDFAGFGASPVDWDAIERPNEPFGRAPDGARQIEAACRHIAGQTGAGAIDIIAHSWGTIPARLFAAQRPERVGRLVLFGPIARRDNPAMEAVRSASHLITIEDQHSRFTEDAPPGHPPVLLERHFAQWAERYLDTDAASRTRTPPAVRAPSGPVADIGACWSGAVPYEPRRITAPVAVIRGEWDSLCTDKDAAGLLAELATAREKRDIKLPRGTHLMHLEEGRTALWEAATAFLLDRPNLTNPKGVRQ